MAKEFNGKTYYWVDTVMVEEVIYDVYEDDFENYIYVAIDTLY